MPMNLFIPYIGSVLVLTEDWTFDLFFESRNRPLLKALYTGPAFDPKQHPNESPYSLKYMQKSHGGYERDWFSDPRYRIEKAMSDKELETASRTHRQTRHHDNPYVMATLPAGTPLRVVRVYIKQGIDAYSSLTFTVSQECRDKKLRGKRFWAKLKDVNTIVCEPI